MHACQHICTYDEIHVTMHTHTHTNVPFDQAAHRLLRREVYLVYFGIGYNR